MDANRIGKWTVVGDAVVMSSRDLIDFLNFLERAACQVEEGEQDLTHLQQDLRAIKGRFYEDASLARSVSLYADLKMARGADF